MSAPAAIASQLNATEYLAAHPRLARQIDRLANQLLTSALSAREEAELNGDNPEPLDEARIVAVATNAVINLHRAFDTTMTWPDRKSAA